MITTERLTILPLSYDQLIEYCKNRMGSVTSDEDENWVIENCIIPMRNADEKDKIYWTIWTILNKENEVVGDMGFHKPPNGHGEIEIGYSINEEYRGKGYATEAVTGILEWCNDKENIIFVLAAVEGDNVASQRVLIKTGFKYICQSQDMDVWRKQIKN